MKAVSIVSRPSVGEREIRSRLPLEARDFSSEVSYRVWGPPNSLSNRLQGLVPWGKMGKNVQLTTHPSTRNTNLIGEWVTGVFACVSVS